MIKQKITYNLAKRLSKRAQDDIIDILGTEGAKNIEITWGLEDDEDN